MSTIALLGTSVLIFVALVAITKIAAKQQQVRVAKAPEYRLRSVMNTSEKNLFEVLTTRLQNDAIVLAMVRLADVIEPTQIDKQERLVAFRRISQKHLDFVILRPTDRKAVVAIELDGPTHLKFKQQRADGDKNAFLESAGLRLFRIDTDAARNSRFLEEVISHVRNSTLSGRVQEKTEGRERLRAG